MSGQNKRIAEIRVHGVSGTPIEQMLDDPWPQQVAGDDDGRIFRRTHFTPPDRVVEGYHWGRYTAGSPSRALWLLLLPFALVNVARFALLLPRRRRRRDRLADAVLRLLGLLLTLTIVVTTCYLAFNVLARQCTGATCDVDSWLLHWFGGRSPGVRLVVAALLPTALLAVFWQFDRLAFPLDPPGPRRARRPGGNGDVGDPGFWRGAHAASLQRAAHVWAGCAVAGLLALAMLGLPRGWPGPFTAAWGVVTVLLLAGLATSLLVVLADPAPDTGDDGLPSSDGHDTVALRRWTRVTRYLTAGSAVLAVALAAIGLDHLAPPGPRAASHLFAGVANGVSALLGLVLLVLLAVCAWLARGEGGRQLRDVPKPFRPFYGGMAGWMGASIGATAGLGMSAAAVFWTAGALGDPVVESAGPPTPGRIEVAAVYWVMAGVWGALAVLLAVSLLPLAAWLLRRTGWWVLFLILAVALTVDAVRVLPGASPAKLAEEAEWLLAGFGAVVAASLAVFLLDRDGFERLLCADYVGERGLDPARARVAFRWRIALVRYRYHHVLGLLAILGGAAVIAAAVQCGRLTVQPQELGLLPAPLTRLGVLVVTLGATGLAVLGLGTWRKPALRTGVGIVWDLLSFWPRLGHPLCPPPYGGRAVLAVAARATQLATEPLPAPAGQVVLSGHSQGSVITAAAVAVLEELRREDGDRARIALGKLHLITYGSQLQFLYARFFPSYFGYAVLRGVHHGLGGRWRNVYRWTDPLGGPVLAWADAGFGPDIERWWRMDCAPGCPGHTAQARCGCETPCGGENCPKARYWAVGPDLRLRDPATIEDSAFQPRQHARGHSGYLTDPAYECVLDDLLAGRFSPCAARPAPFRAGSGSPSRAR